MPRWLQLGLARAGRLPGGLPRYPLVVLVRTVGAGGAATASHSTRLGVHALAGHRPRVRAGPRQHAARALAIGLPLANVVSRYRLPGASTRPGARHRAVRAADGGRRRWPSAACVGDGVPQGFLLVVAAHAYVNLAVVARIVGAQWAQHDARLRERRADARRDAAMARLHRRDPAQPAARDRVQRGRRVRLLVHVARASCCCWAIRDAHAGVADPAADLGAPRLPGCCGDRRRPARPRVAWFCWPAPAPRAGRRRARCGRATLRALPRRCEPRPAVLFTVIAAYLVVLAPVLALVFASLRAGGRWSLDWWSSIGSRRRRHHPHRLAPVRTRHVDRIRPGDGARGRRRRRLAAIAVVAPGRTRIVALLAMVPLGVSSATLGPRHPARLRAPTARPAADADCWSRSPTLSSPSRWSSPSSHPRCGPPTAGAIAVAASLGARPRGPSSPPTAPSCASSCSRRPVSPRPSRSASSAPRPSSPGPARRPCRCRSSGC